MTVAYPENGVQDLAITWPDMRESFPCEKGRRLTCRWDFSCEGKNPAEWITRLACCGRAVLYCTQCKEGILAARSLQTRCCETVYRPASTAYTSIEPLGVT